ncbi:MAG: hypothetical protein AB1775_01945 [Bacteroidota bacterium]
MDSSSDKVNQDQLVSYLQNLESRISRIESHLQLDEYSSENEFKLPPIFPRKISDQADNLEETIGQFWFAKVGIVILAIGIVFLLTFPYKNLPSALPSLFGYAIVGVLMFLSRYSSKSLPFLSHYIFGGGLLLLYFTTLRLHYFGIERAIESETVETILLTISSVLYLVIAYRRKSIYLSSIGITLAAITILISNNSYSVFLSLMVLSFFIVHLKIKFDWNPLYNFGIVLVYLTNFIWFINDPVIGNQIGLRTLPEINLFAYLVYAAIFVSASLYNQNKEAEKYTTILNSLFNCFGSYGFFLLITLLKYKEILPLSHFVASIVFLTISVLFWVKEESKYATFFYSILGYTALSIAIVAQFKEPDYFVWLSWQSIIVVSTAIWFRSKFIIVANFVMYLIIFFSYLALSGSFGVVSLSFGIVALTSARILNWKKDRLDLKTEVMRNSYLAAAFFIFPYALYHIMPQNYVSLSWTLVALSYYVMSVILKNKKYRWMALLTFLLTVLHVLFVGTTDLDPSYRIVSFIFLGIVLVLISALYARKKSKSVLPADAGVESSDKS